MLSRMARAAIADWWVLPVKSAGLRGDIFRP